MNSIMVHMDYLLVDVVYMYLYHLDHVVYHSAPLIY